MSEEQKKKKTLVDIIEKTAEEVVEKTYVSYIPESKESAERNKAILKCLFKIVGKASMFDALFRKKEGEKD